MYQKIKAKFKASPTIFYACSIVASWAGVGSLMNFRTIALRYGAVPGWDADLLEMLNSTTDEADEVIGSYGDFPENEIAPINRHQAEEHVPYAETPTYPVAPATQPAPTVSAAPQQPSTVLEVSTPSEPQTAAPEADSGVEQHRCIRCPKCGELICL